MYSALFNRKFKLNLTCLWFISFTSFSQSVFTVSGHVYDRDGFSPIEGALVRCINSEGKEVVTKTNSLGFYIFDIINGTRVIKANQEYFISASAERIIRSDSILEYCQHPNKIISTIGVKINIAFKLDFYLFPQRKYYRDVSSEPVYYHSVEIKGYAMCLTKDSFPSLVFSFVEYPEKKISLFVGIKQSNDESWKFGPGDVIACRLKDSTFVFFDYLCESISVDPNFMCGIFKITVGDFNRCIDSFLTHLVFYKNCEKFSYPITKHRELFKEVFKK